jgi:hypothetical protein
MPCHHSACDIVLELIDDHVVFGTGAYAREHEQAIG